MRTGEDVKELGLYSSECCLQDILFDTGDSFSRCPRCSKLTAWERVDDTLTSDELRVMKDSAGIGSRWPRKSDLIPELRGAA